MTADSKKMLPRDVAEQQNWLADSFGVWRNSSDDSIALPVYEGRMIGQFSSFTKGWVQGKGRTAKWKNLTLGIDRPEPQYLIRQADYLEQRVSLCTGELKVGVMDVASATNARTTIATVLPDFIPCGHKVPCLILKPGSLLRALGLLAIVNSFSFDYIARQRVGGLSLGWFILRECQIPHFERVEEVPEIFKFAARLGLTSSLYSPQWLELATIFSDVNFSTVPKNWALTAHERLRIRCILDALIAELYHLETSDVSWLLRSDEADPKGFWRVDKSQPPELRHPVLTQIAFHDLKRLGRRAFLDQHEGEGWQLPATLRLADFGLGHDERAQTPQPVAAALGPRFLDWQLKEDVTASWEECAHHAAILAQLLPDASPASTPVAPPTTPTAPTAPTAPGAFALTIQEAATPKRRGPAKRRA